MNTSSITKRFGNERGYSLIELMTVVAIVSLVAYLGASKVKSYFRTPSDVSELEDLKRAIQSARNYTITSENCGTVTVVGNAVQIVKYQTCGPPLADPSPIIQYEFSNIILNNFSIGNTLTFLPGGGTDQTKPVTMSVHTNSGRDYEIKVMPAIGAIRILKR